MNINFRKGKPRDAEICASICYEAFKAIADQHHFPPDFPDRESAFGLIPQLLSREDIYSVIAESDGRVVGSNFLGKRRHCRCRPDHGRAGSTEFSDRKTVDGECSAAGAPASFCRREVI